MSGATKDPRDNSGKQRVRPERVKIDPNLIQEMLSMRNQRLSDEAIPERVQNRTSERETNTPKTGKMPGISESSDKQRVRPESVRINYGFTPSWMREQGLITAEIQGIQNQISEKETGAQKTEKMPGISESSDKQRVRPENVRINYGFSESWMREQGIDTKEIQGIQNRISKRETEAQKTEKMPGISENSDTPKVRRVRFAPDADRKIYNFEQNLASTPQERYPEQWARETNAERLDFKKNSENLRSKYGLQEEQKPKSIEMPSTSASDLISPRAEKMRAQRIDLSAIDFSKIALSSGQTIDSEENAENLESHSEEEREDHFDRLSDTSSSESEDVPSNDFSLEDLQKNLKDLDKDFEKLANEYPKIAESMPNAREKFKKGQQACENLSSILPSQEKKEFNFQTGNDFKGLMTSIETYKSSLNALNKSESIMAPIKLIMLTNVLKEIQKAFPEIGYKAPESGHEAQEQLKTPKKEVNQSHRVR